MAEPIIIIKRDTKTEARAHRRGEQLYVYDNSVDKATLLPIWSHDPAISQKAIRSFKRRFMKPKGGWPWSRKEPLEDETMMPSAVKIEAVRSSKFVAPRYPGQEESIKEDYKEPVVGGALPKIDMNFVESFTDTRASRPDRGVVLLEYQGFAAQPKVYLFQHYDMALRHIKEHPDTREIVSRAGLSLPEMNYGDYEIACRQFASRTTTFFTLQVCPFK